MKNHAVNSSLQELLNGYEDSPYPSFKVSNYFPIYDDLFSHLRGTECTFIETGILDGGSLFMWRNWLGDKARIIGIDLNPEANKWKEHGFEIFIGDQGDPQFWKQTFEEIGDFDALLDDGGHQSFQQIVTAYEAIRVANRKCIIAVEDTCSNFMKNFSRHGKDTFLEFSKGATDNLLANTDHFFPGQFPLIKNPKSVEHFKNVYSVQFFSGIVAFKIDPTSATRPELTRNKPSDKTSDFRYDGVESAVVEWPSPFKKRTVLVKGGKRSLKKFVIRLIRSVSSR